MIPSADALLPDPGPEATLESFNNSVLLLPLVILCHQQRDSEPDRSWDCRRIP